MELSAQTAPIHRVLENHLTDEQLSYALRLWKEEFIRQPNFSLKKYVEKLCSTQSISVSSNRLYDYLLPAMMEAFKAPKSSNDLLDDVKVEGDSLPNVVASESLPVSSETEATIQHNTVTDNVQQHAGGLDKAVPIEAAEVIRVEKSEVYSLFIHTLCSRMPTASLEKLLRTYEDDIKGCCPFSIKDSFFAWLSNDSDYFHTEGLEVEEMVTITHILYMGMCDYLGPIKADNILSYSANLVSTTYPNTEFSIDQIL